MTSSTVKPRWNPWPISIIVFFAVAISGCVTFIVFCSRHPADLVAADYYEQEVKYQSQMEKMEWARQQAADSSISYDAQAKQIVVSLNPQGVGNVQGTIQLYRPSAINQDKVLKLQPNANGRQQIDTVSLSPGLWKVRVSWKLAEREDEIQQSVFVNSSKLVAADFRKL